jgi:hypothetical protein
MTDPKNSPEAPSLAELLASMAEMREALAASEERANAATAAAAAAAATVRESGARQWAGNVPVPEAMADMDRWAARVYPEVYAALGVEVGNREVIRLITVASKAYGYVQKERSVYGAGKVPGPAAKLAETGARFPKPAADAAPSA